MSLLSILNKIFGTEDNDEFLIREPTISPITVIDLDRKFHSFSIIPRVYEERLDKKYGVVLGKLKNGKRSNFKGDLKNNVSFNGSGVYSKWKIDDRILMNYEHIPDFCSMKIANKEELMEHIQMIHELSYNHYVFGKQEDMKGLFPNWCCGYSSNNLLLTLMEKGYPNATFFYNKDYDHAYNALPFLFGENQEKGFIIVDPTSDQLFNDKINAPRNNVFVVFGEEWEYKTDWQGGANLFPKVIDSSKFANLYTLRSFPGSTVYESKEIRKYFSEVFKNPVDVQIKPF